MYVYLKTQFEFVDRRIVRHSENTTFEFQSGKSRRSYSRNIILFCSLVEIEKFYVPIIDHVNTYLK